MLFLFFFISVFMLVYALLVFFSERNQTMKRRLAMITQTDVKHKAGESHIPKEASMTMRFLLPLWKEFKRGFKKNMPGEKEAKIEMKLQQAGRPYGMTPVDFRLLQICLLLALPILFGFLGYASRASFGGLLLLILIGAVAAVFLPNYVLVSKKKERSRLALRELPDVLDLLTVSLEAGLGFDAALSKLVSKKHGVLAAEFHRCLEEIRLGKTRREALIGVKERLSLDEIKTLISSILQAEKLGIGLVQVMRIQSEEVRDQRKQRAEEAAMKAPIKMLFPLVLFIFPCLFIILLGPAAIQFIETFSK